MSRKVIVRFQVPEEVSKLITLLNKLIAKDLHRAIKEGDYKKVKKIIDDNKEKGYIKIFFLPNEFGQNIFHLTAMYCNDVQKAEELIKLFSALRIETLKSGEVFSTDPLTLKDNSFSTPLDQARTYTRKWSEETVNLLIADLDEEIEKIKKNISQSEVENTYLQIVLEIKIVLRDLSKFRHEHAIQYLAHFYKYGHHGDYQQLLLQKGFDENLLESIIKICSKFHQIKTCDIARKKELLINSIVYISNFCIELSSCGKEMIKNKNSLYNPKLLFSHLEFIYYAFQGKELKKYIEVNLDTLLECIFKMTADFKNAKRILKGEELSFEPEIQISEQEQNQIIVAKNFEFHKIIQVMKDYDTAQRILGYIKVLNHQDLTHEIGRKNFITILKKIGDLSKFENLGLNFSHSAKKLLPNLPWDLLKSIRDSLDKLPPYIIEKKISSGTIITFNEININLQTLKENFMSSIGSLCIFVKNLLKILEFGIDHVGIDDKYKNYLKFEFESTKYFAKYTVNYEGHELLNTMLDDLLKLMPIHKKCLDALERLRKGIDSKAKELKNEDLTDDQKDEIKTKIKDLEEKYEDKKIKMSLELESELKKEKEIIARIKNDISKNEIINKDSLDKLKNKLWRKIDDDNYKNFIKEYYESLSKSGPTGMWLLFEEFLGKIEENQLSQAKYCDKLNDKIDHLSSFFKEKLGDAVFDEIAAIYTQYPKQNFYQYLSETTHLKINGYINDICKDKISEIIIDGLIQDIRFYISKLPDNQGFQTNEVMRGTTAHFSAVHESLKTQTEKQKFNELIGICVKTKSDLAKYKASLDGSSILPVEGVLEDAEDKKIKVTDQDSKKLKKAKEKEDAKAKAKAAGAGAGSGSASGARDEDSSDEDSSDEEEPASLALDAVAEHKDSEAAQEFQVLAANHYSDLEGELALVGDDGSFEASIGIRDCH